MTAILTLPEPCTRMVNHAPHLITVVNPWTPSMVFNLACPGSAPAPASNASQPAPLIPATTSETPL